MAKPKRLKFEPSARIQGLFGRELISNDYVATAEVVRNAYDAGAKEITIALSAKSPQRITILDNGSGMSLDEFQKAWMTPGYSEKKEETQQESGRKILGEKGIGRFAVDKLASKLRVTTKRKNRPPITALFDWTRFEDQDDYLKDIKITVHEVHDEELIKQAHGTRLELTDLRKIWEAKGWLNLRRELKNLLLPSGKVSHFKIIANSGLGESGEIKTSFDGRNAYEYYFSINKEGRILWSLTRPDKILAKIKKEKNMVVPKNLSGTESITNTFGFVKGHFYVLESSASIKKQGYDSGVGIYRDGFRVEPYGRKDDDWLEVKLLKAKRQGKAPITPSKLFGYVEISRGKNFKLKDLTNREGIQDSKEFEAFRETIINRFLHFADYIAEDQKNLPLSPSIRAQRLKGDIKNKAQAVGDMAAQLAHQLRQPMSHILTTVTTLKRHVTREYSNDEKVQKYSERIQRNVERLDSNIKGLTVLGGILKEPPTDFDLQEVIADLYKKHKPNFEQQSVDLIAQCDITGTTIKFSRPALEMALEVYLENALRSTIKAGAKLNNPSVVLRVSKGKIGKVRISVEDSGGGVPKTLEDILFKKFVLNSEGEGAGLYFAKSNIESFDGYVGYENLPKDGAIFYVEI